MGERRGMNSTHLKNRNRGLVLQHIATGSHASRADIAKRIHLTKMTVGNIVTELIDDGYIEERETADNTAVGRNPVLLDIAPRAPKLLGLYLSRGEASVLLTDLRLQLLFRDALPLQAETADSLTGKLYRLIDHALEAAHVAGYTVIGIGISSIGPLDTQNGIILHPTDFFGIADYPVNSLMREHTGLPVFLNNDMNAAALAEKFFGLGRNLDNFLYLGLSNGIGSGIVSNGRLYQDNSGFVGEIGHTCIQMDGERCSCGNPGCLEVYANMPILLQKLRQITGRPTIGYADFEEISLSPAGNKVLSDAMRALSVALVNAVNLLDPQEIILGHEGAYLPATYLRQLEVSVNRHILAAGYKKLRIVKSAFGVQSPLFGSVCCVLNELFAGRLF